MRVCKYTRLYKHLNKNNERAIHILAYDIFYKKPALGAEFSFNNLNFIH